jgi:spore germination protein
MSMIIYTVAPGDTIYQIARDQGVLPGAVVAANGLEAPDRLVVGQSLIIPTTVRDYTAIAGDSLFKIAQRFGITLPTLLAANPQFLNSDLLRIGQRIQLPYLGRGGIVVNGYCYPSISEDALAEGLRHLSILSIFSCTVGSDGGLTPMTNDGRAILRAKAARVRPHMVITNLTSQGFEPGIARAVLSSPETQMKLLRSCAALMGERGYTGLDVDFENVPGDSREALGGFLARAHDVMHENKWLLTSAVPPLTKDNQSGLLYEGFDFVAEGKYNDYVTLMTYEYGYQGGPPGAVAPINQVRRALEYAISRMPKQKILMGIPNYGYDWKTPYQRGTNATVVSNTGAVSIAAREGAVINYDAAAQAPWLRYQEPGGQRHEIWFEDARSIQAKLNLVREFGIAGLGYWTVNALFPQNWTLVEDQFRVQTI